jgi:enamine deaminase RidA (YjgF/YER057c/UK114 family)
LDHLTHINPPTLSDSLAVGYSQVIVAKPGRLVFVAGQVGWDENSEMVGDASFPAQARKAIDNVRVALNEAGATGNDVTHVKYFVVGLTEDRVGELIEALSETKVFNHERPPTGTLIGVEKLARDALLIEIEVIAVIPD